MERFHDRSPLERLPGQTTQRTRALILGLLSSCRTLRSSKPNKRPGEQIFFPLGGGGRGRSRISKIGSPALPCRCFRPERNILVTDVSQVVPNVGPGSCGLVGFVVDVVFFSSLSKIVVRQAGQAQPNSNDDRGRKRPKNGLGNPFAKPTIEGTYDQVAGQPFSEKDFPPGKIWQQIVQCATQCSPYVR